MCGVVVWETTQKEVRGDYNLMSVDEEGASELCEGYLIRVQFQSTLLGKHAQSQHRPFNHDKSRLNNL